MPFICHMRLSIDFCLTASTQILHESFVYSNLQKLTDSELWIKDANKQKSMGDRFKL